MLFSITSLAGGLAPSSGLLITARGVQGFSCALMAASSLAIITSSFEPGPQLHRAIGLWAAMNGAGGAAGTLLGGVITQTLSWRWVLLINPPIGIAAALVAYAVVADRRRAHKQGFDLAGALTLTVGQIVLVYGVVKAGTNGWSSPAALVPIILGLALLAVFCVVETRISSAPLVPFKELTKPLRNANTIVLLFSAALFPMWFVSSLYLQQVLGLSPLHAGLTFLPMALTIMFVARSAGKLVSRFGVRAVLGSGLLMMTGGMLLFTKIADSGSAIVYVMIPGLLTAAGIGLSIVPSTIAATQGAKQGQAGLASGLVNTSRQIGGGLGIAVLITLATQRTTHLIGGGQAVPQALTEGFRLAYLIGAVLCAAAAVFTFATVPKPAAGQGPAVRLLPLSVGVAGVIGAFILVDFAFGGSHGAPIGQYTTGSNTYSFVSQPSLHPPIARADVVPNEDQLPQGDIFIANFYDLTKPPIVGQSGPLIYDNHLSPVWFKPVPEDIVAGNLSLQTYQGKPALSWWQGYLTNTGETVTGEDVVVNQHYQTVATLKGVDGWVPTLHEMVIQGDHAWVTVNKNIPKDLSKYGGAYNGALVDSAVQEYSLSTGKLLYSWDALDHISPSDSYASLPTNAFPWDAYHVNSIQLIGQGKFLVSMRNTWAAYLVDTSSGKIEWTLGGKHSSIKLGPHADFAVAARRGAAPRLDDLDVRRPLLPDHRRWHVRHPDGCVARARAQARPAGTHRHARRRVHPREQLRCRLHGQHAAAGRRRRVRRLGFAVELLDVRRLEQDDPRRCPPAARHHVSRDGRAVGRPAAVSAGRRRARQGRQGHRLRELERRHKGRVVAGPGRVQRRQPDGDWDRRQVGLRDADRAAPELSRVPGPGARRRRPGARDVPAVHRDKLTDLT